MGVVMIKTISLQDADFFDEFYETYEKEEIDVFFDWTFEDGITDFLIVDSISPFYLPEVKMFIEAHSDQYIEELEEQHFQAKLDERVEQKLQERKDAMDRASAIHYRMV